MTLPDLLFLGSVLCITAVLIAIFVSVLRQRWSTARRLGSYLAIFVACYSTMLICVSLSRPRRVYPPAARRCFDDWCVAALDAEPVLGEKSGPCAQRAPGTQVWIAVIQVASEARRVGQRAPDAHAELEDEQGSRYAPCGSAIGEEKGTAHALTDYLEPGESFPVRLAFSLPTARTPAGLLVHHGDFPGIIIIGADQSLFHPPALQRLPPRDKVKP